METKTFTPGPWNYLDFEVGSSNEVVYGRSTTNRPIATAFYWSDDSIPHEIVKANARLIASAPDLYEALKEIIDTEWIGGKGGFVKARAALAKARGES